jgi:hypothetical protein
VYVAVSWQLMQFVVLPKFVTLPGPESVHFGVKNVLVPKTASKYGLNA